MEALHGLTSSILRLTGIKYQQDDDDLFGEGDDEDDSEGGVHVRPSDLQKQITSQSIRDLETQRRVTNGLEVFSISEAAGESARALAADEKIRRENQMQASNTSKLYNESQRLKNEEDVQKQKAQEKRQQEKQEEEEREQDKKKKEQEQRQKEEIAIQSANAERSRVEQSERDCNNRILADVKRAAVPGRSGTYSGMKFHADGPVEGISPFFIPSVIWKHCID